MKLVNLAIAGLLSPLALVGPSMADSPPNPTGPLEEFQYNFFNGLFVSSNETLFQETFDSGYSRDLVENGNGVDFNFTSFKAFVEEQRQLFTNRRLVSTTYTIIPDDSTGLTGDVGHVAVVAADLNGAPVLATIVAVLHTALDCNGKQVNTAERFVLGVQPAE